MQLSRRRLLELAGAGAATAFLAGCSGQLPEADTSSSSFGVGASGNVEVWTRAATQTGMQGIVDAFHKSQSRISITLTPVLDTQYVTKLATAIRGGEPPDVVDMDDINSSLFIFRDVFTDLTRQVDALPFRSKLSPGHLNLATKDGRHFGVPFLADNSLLWINTDLFEKAHLDVTQATESHETLLEAVAKISELGSDVFGWSFPGNAAGALGFTFLPMVWAAKTDLFAGTIGSQTAHISDNSALRSTLQFYRSMWTRKYVPQANYSDAATHWGSDFLAGTIGIFPANYATVVTPAPKGFLDHTKNVIIPGPTGGRSFFDGGDNICIPRGAKNPSAAWEFAKFAISLTQQQSIPAYGYTPIRSDANTTAFAQKYPFATPPLKHLSDGYASRTLAYNEAINQVSGPFLEMFRQAVFGGDLSGALNTGQTNFQRILTAVQS